MNKLKGVIHSSNEICGNISPKSQISVNIVGTGATGRDGLSAYEIWLKEGNEGTLQDFLDSLKANYTHPERHPASIIEESEDKMFISLEDKQRISGYVHEQIKSKKTWIINHPLDKNPSVSIVDTGGNLVQGSVEYVSKSQIIVDFSSEFSGKAFLN